MNDQSSGLQAQNIQAGAGMLRRFGPLYWLSGMAFWFRRLRMDNASVENIRKAHSNGPVVYVMYTKSRLDWIAFNQVLNRRRLPLAQFTAGLSAIWVRPLLDLLREGGRWVTQFWSSAMPPQHTLIQKVRMGQTNLVFLVRPRGLGTESTGMLSALADWQAQSDRAIQLVPIAVVWNRAPQAKRSETTRFLLGAEDEPGPIQKFLDVMNRAHEPIVQAGAAVDLQEALNHFGEVSSERRIRAIQLLLRRYLYRELHVVRGPYARSYNSVQRQVLESADVQKFIKTEAIQHGVSEASLRKAAEKSFGHFAARFSYRMVSIAAWGCRVLWDRIYSGIDIREEDLERLRTALRNGTPILLPCHRSHLDYLLLSSLCFEEGLVLPHVVAGENLAFFPVAPFLRRCGAFFIKRSFKGQRLFPVLFGRYLRLLIRDEYPIELFIEGGRSRTGKLLTPRLGVLEMIVDSAVDIRPDRCVSLLPIAISYEQIAEEKAYARELSGASKEKEDMRGLLKASRIFKKRFGKVYIRVGEPIDLSAQLRQQKPAWVDLSPPERTEVLGELANHVMFGIAQNMLILPTAITAMALLTDASKGVRIKQIQDRAVRFNALMMSRGAQCANSMGHGGWVVMEALSRFLSEKWISKMVDSQGDIIQIFPEARITISYYKNSVLHFIAPVSLAASAIQAAPSDPMAQSQFFDFLVFLFRYEFLMPPEQSTEEVFQDALEHLVEYGALSDKDGHFEVSDPARLKELACLTHCFIDSYLLVLRGCLEFQYRSITLKELPHQLQQFGQARLAIDEVRYPEALSFVNIGNAVRAFREEKVLVFRQDGGLKLDEFAVEQYISDLTTLMP
ncbi:MAG: 1-acyl-sn-glycerol-3-phosphate acyltransferase [Myxococcota bacterium]